MAKVRSCLVLHPRNQEPFTPMRRCDRVEDEWRDASVSSDSGWLTSSAPHALTRCIRLVELGAASYLRYELPDSVSLSATIPTFCWLVELPPEYTSCELRKYSAPLTFPLLPPEKVF